MKKIIFGFIIVILLISASPTKVHAGFFSSIGQGINKILTSIKGKVKPNETQTAGYFEASSSSIDKGIKDGGIGQCEGNKEPNGNIPPGGCYWSSGGKKCIISQNPAYDVSNAGVDQWTVICSAGSTYGANDTRAICTIDSLINNTGPTRDLTSGLTNDPEVKKLQQNLTQLGYILDENGNFDGKTITALKLFQKLKKIPQTGIFDRATKLEMCVATANTGVKTNLNQTTNNSFNTSNTNILSPSNSITSVFKNLSYGMTNNSNVKTLQNNLKALGYSVNVDGNYGVATFAAIQSFQKSKGLKVTGLLDSTTNSAILSTLTAKNSTTTSTDGGLISTGIENVTVGGKGGSSGSGCDSASKPFCPRSGDSSDKTTAVCAGSTWICMQPAQGATGTTSSSMTVSPTADTNIGNGVGGTALSRFCGSDPLKQCPLVGYHCLGGQCVKDSVTPDTSSSLKTSPTTNIANQSMPVSSTVSTSSGIYTDLATGVSDSLSVTLNGHISMLAVPINTTLDTFFEYNTDGLFNGTNNIGLRVSPQKKNSVDWYSTTIKNILPNTIYYYRLSGESVDSSGKTVKTYHGKVYAFRQTVTLQTQEKP